MRRKTLIISLFCGSAVLAGCSESDPTPIVISNIATIEDNNDSIDETEGQLVTDTSANDTLFFDGTYNWTIVDELTVNSNEPSDLDTRGWQKELEASNEDVTLQCVSYARYHDDTVGLSTEFTQLTGNSGSDYISVDDFEAVNGPAKEYLAAYTQDNDVRVNTIGHFYYFPASQLSYGITTSRLVECNATAALYAGFEESMRKTLAGVTFREVPELENRVDEDWSGLSSANSDDFSRVRFRNFSDTEVTVFWIDLDGVRKSLGQVAAGNSIALDSRKDHLIVVVDPSGVVVGQFRADGEDSLATIR